MTPQTHLHVAHRTHVDLPPLPPDERQNAHRYHYVCRWASEHHGHLDHCLVNDPDNCEAWMIEQSGLEP